MNKKKAIIGISILSVSILIFGSVGIYFLYFHDREKLYPLDLSDKVLSEDGSTEEGMEDVVLSHNQFAFDMYDRISNNSTDNIIFSPLSIFISLCMLYEGARGETREEMKEVLHLSDDDELRRGSFAEIQNDLNGREGRVTMKLANRLWNSLDVEVDVAYKKIIEESYFADIESADLRGDPEGSREIMNEWVEDETNGKIDDLIPPGFLTGNTALVLINALYFKGDWETSFKRSDTKERDFHTVDNRTLQVPIMYIDPEDLKDDTYFKGFNDGSIQAHELPYKGRSISMVLMMPGRSDHDLERAQPSKIFEMEKNLSANRFYEINSGFENSEKPIYLPKFEFESKFSLNDHLKDLGMNKVMDPNEADLTGIAGDGDDHLGASVHQSNIKVNEEGTEASAATALSVVDGAAAFPFNADRPFMFIIQDRETGLILFMGRVMDPTQS